MVLELSEGCELVIDGEPWTVEKLEPYWGRVTLRSGDGPGGRRRQTRLAVSCIIGTAGSRPARRRGHRGGNASLRRGRT